MRSPALTEAIANARDWVAQDPNGSLRSEVVARLIDDIERAATGLPGPVDPHAVDLCRVAVVLDALTDGADCWYGDAERCAQHGFTAWERCPHDEAKELLAQMDDGTGH